MVRVDKRKVFGPFYGPLVKARHSYPMRMASGLAVLPSQHLRARRNPGTLAVDIEGVMGMGALLAFALRLYHYAEVQGLRPRIVSTNPLYSTGRGVDCLEPHLGSDHHSFPPSQALRFHNFESLFYLRIPRHLSLERASSLFWRYLPPRKEINQLVDSALVKVPTGQFDLSLHYRGTDKVLEAEAAKLNLVEAAVGRHQAAGGLLRHVFLATDDPAFERFVIDRWPRTTFSTFNLGRPADAEVPRHFSNLRPEDKTVEAIVNMLLIARAPACIRTVSYMSALSKIMNPTLRTHTLNRTFDGSKAFPEHEILADEGAHAPFGGSWSRRAP